MRRPLLLGLLLAAELLYIALARLDAINGVEPVLAFLALMAGLFAVSAAAFAVVRDWSLPGREVWWIAACGAVLFRLTLLPAGLPHEATLAELGRDLRADLRAERVVYQRFLLYDTDLWRYLWDGHVWAHGVNPFAHAPNAEALDWLADVGDPPTSDGRSVWRDVRDNINHPHIPTIYPPLAQLVFRASHGLAPGSVVVMKALMVGFDLLAGAFIVLTLRALGRSPAWAVLYLWNPLVVKVFAASGHVDSLVAAGLSATAYFVVTRRNALAALSFSMAVLSKLAPLCLVPFLARRLGWRNMVLVAAVVTAGYTPFLDAGDGLFAGLAAFAKVWQFNAGPFTFVQHVIGWFSTSAPGVARAVCGAVLAALLLQLWRRDDGRPDTLPAVGGWALGALLVLSPAVMPWYVAWLLPFAVVAQQGPWVAFSGIVCMAFLVMMDGVEHVWVLGVEYGALGWLVLRRLAPTAAPTPAAEGDLSVPRQLRESGIFLNREWADSRKGERNAGSMGAGCDGELDAARSRVRPGERHGRQARATRL